MYLGIDIGGTFTDAVVIEEGQILAWAKGPTYKEDLLGSLLSTLDEVLPKIDKHRVERVTLSTTFVTNIVVEGREEPVDIYVIPGPGASLEGRLPRSPIYVEGYTDHRGKVAKALGDIPLNRREKGHTLALASAKFAVRNPQEEMALSRRLKEAGYDVVSEGAKLSGSLNFIRRTNSAYFNSAVSTSFKIFKAAVEEALQKRGLTCPIYILKADGGSLPLSAMAERPVETIFTGPAASVLGMEALLTMSEGMVVAVDIGGTTSDISLWRGGQPLMARGGVYIKDFPSSVRCFQVYSVGIGGDSYVRYEEGQLKVGPERLGPAMALGGSEPTLGDALLLLGYCQYGDLQRAKAAMTMLVNAKGDGEEDLLPMAREVVVKALDTIKRGIDRAIEMENKKPIYVVADIVNPHAFKGEELVIVGGTAPALGPSLGEFLQIPYSIPEAAAVANAVGAAVSKGTMCITVRVDTRSKTLTVPELGYEEAYPFKPSLQDVKERGQEILEEAMRQSQIEEVFEVEVLSEEEFSIIEGWSREDKLLTVTLQTKAGVREHVL